MTDDDIITIDLTVAEARLLITASAHFESLWSGRHPATRTDRQHRIDGYRRCAAKLRNAVQKMATS